MTRHSRIGPWANGVAPFLSGPNMEALEQAALAGINRGAITVAASSVPQAVKDGCDFVCDGVNDQVQINAASILATRTADGFSGGQGRGLVQLIGGEFSIADDNTTCIVNYPNVVIQGLGEGTNISPKWTADNDRGAFEFLDNTVSRAVIRHLWIGKANATGFNGHGVKWVQSGEGSAYDMKTGADSFNMLDGVTINRAGRHGAWLSGATGGARESRVFNCVFWNATRDGLFIDGASDNQVIGCRSNSGGSAYSAFHIGGGNSKIADSKAYFSDGDGFLIDSSRCEVGDCSAQDNGRHGFNFQSADFTANGLVADSNARLGSAAGSGFNIAAKGVLSGFHAFDRGQTPGNPQTRPVVLSGTNVLFLTGMTRLGTGGATHVTGSADAASFVRVVREGSTVLAVG